MPSWSTCCVRCLPAAGRPEGGLAVRAMECGPSVAEMFTHMHYARLVLVSEDAPEVATQAPEESGPASGTLIASRRCLPAAGRLERKRQGGAGCGKEQGGGRPGHGPSL